MKSLSFPALAVLLLTGPALAQAPADHGQHHPGATPPPQSQAAPAQPPGQMPMGQMPMGQMPMGQMGQMGQMMQAMPEQCRVMMQNMMHQMMGGATMPGGMQGRGMTAAPSQAAGQSDAAKGYAAALDKMHDPMTQGIADPDPDAAFVKGMIPHHQSAIDMAKVVLQHGKDEAVKKWANDVVREQEREIAEMQAWLKKHGKL
jgi:Domain of unknown function (DUF305)